MAVMIKLQLDASSASFDAVQALPGLADIPLDREFGLVCIDPAADLFVVRTDRMNDLEYRRKMSPQIVDAYGDVRIGTT